MDFDTWFDIVVAKVRKAGYSFNDQDSVQQDFDDGKSPEQVAQEIIKEYE